MCFTKTYIQYHELSLLHQEVECLTSNNVDPDELTCGNHLVSLFQSDPRSLGELLWVHWKQGRARGKLGISTHLSVTNTIAYLL